MKRFTETTKWDDPWFAALPGPHKLVCLYLYDKCDHGGFWPVNIPLIEFQAKADLLVWTSFLDHAVKTGRVVIDGERVWLTRFVSFQFPRGLHPKDPMRISVQRCFAKCKNLKDLLRGLEAPAKALIDSILLGATQGLPSLSGEGEGEGEGELGLPGTKNPPTLHPEQVRIGALFHRRNGTPWGKKELAAWRTISPIPEEDLKLIEARYTSSDPYLRRDLQTLLNNWKGELDRARTPRNGKEQSDAKQARIRQLENLYRREDALGYHWDGNKEAHAEWKTLRQELRATAP